MLDGGLRAVLTCVDPNQLDPQFVGREYEPSLLEEFPPTVDPCGERGEFHSFCYRGPMFARAIPIEVGQTVCRDGFWFADVQPAAV
jgi:diphthamide synthase (EF-2-diphthine--ammonia ligase)